MLLSKLILGNQERDIGQTTTSNTTLSKYTLKTDAQRVLKDVHDAIGNEQVTIKKLEFAPSWLTEEAFKNEYDSNWAASYVPVSEFDLPTKANVITSHVV